MTVTEGVTILHVALAAHDAGLSVIPIRDDGSKKPALSWKQYQSVRADRQQVRAWFAPGRHRAIGVVCGEVSGWLTMLEMEGWAYDAGYWQTFKDTVEDALGVARWAEIVRYVELSPTGGPHIYFRCPGHTVGNLKLAKGLDDDGELVVMMETRGEGGYSVIAGSEGHATGNPWRAVQGSVEDICDVTPEELELIFRAARSLDQSPDSSPKVEADDVQASASLPAGTGEVPHSPVPTSDPGIRSDTAHHWMDATIDDFNETTSVLAWLDGWSEAGTDTFEGETVVRLHRDGSDNDHGAVLFQSGRVGFFSSNCPPWAEPFDGIGKLKTYDPFTVMMWEDNGTNDTKARVVAAIHLRGQGFGPQVEPDRMNEAPCPWCGGAVRTTVGPGRPRMYCSSTCRQVHHRARHDGIGISLGELGDRDNWTCGICEGRIWRHTPVRNLRPSIDHIVPQSKGGGHEPENLRISHLVCNIRRGNEDYPQEFTPIDGFSLENLPFPEVIDEGEDLYVFDSPVPGDPEDSVTANITENESQVERPTLRWVEDALANPPDEPDVLVTGLLRRGEITVVGAPRAIGKTWASLNLASICANGEGELFGSEQFRSITPARVLYLQGELGEWGSAYRWQLLGGNMPPKMIAESFERIRIRTTERKVTDVADGTTMVDTYMEAVVDHRLEQLITEVEADVLVIDPWATFFAGNENSNDETEAAIIALTDIARRHNLAVWIVHHITNKGTMSASAEPEDMWRGASRLADAVATRVTMLPYWTPQRAKDVGLDRRTARGQIRVTVLERNGPPVDMVYSELRNHWWSDWEPPDIGRPAELSGKDVVRALEANGGRVDSQRALEAIVDKGHTAVKRVVDHLVGAGVIQTFTGPRNSIGYELTGTGLPE